MVKEVVSRSTAAMREGSNPSSPKQPYRPVVRTSDFESGNPSSILGGATTRMSEWLRRRA